VVEIAYNPQALSGVITNLFRKGLIENGIVGVITNLFRKGLIENRIVGVINRRNASLFKKGLSEKGERL